MVETFIRTVFILLKIYISFFFIVSVVFVFVGHAAGCGINDEVSQWMENIQNSAVEELPEPMSKDIKIPKKRTPPAEDKIILEIEQDEEEQDAAANDGDEDNDSFLNITKHHSNTGSKQQKKTTSSDGAVPTAAPNAAQPPKKYANNKNYRSNGGGGGDNNNNNNGATDDFRYPYEKYTKEANSRFDDTVEAAEAAGLTGYFYDPETGRRFQPTDDDWHERVHERVRRASGTSGTSARREENKNTCSLYIQTDPLIWRHIREGIADVSISKKLNELSYQLLTF